MQCWDELERRYVAGLESAKSHNQLGIVCWETADYKSAIAEFDQAIAVGRELGNVELTGAALNNEGLVYDELGDYKRSLATIPVIASPAV